ncbi:MAG: hypothetical protein SF097_00535 [Acidobacteriota bacterium]|nr:hypothetical protein [Acidobacteriota bacterium]
MAKTKLATSNSEIVLTPQLLERLNAAALEMEITKSGLVALAVEEFLQRQQTRQLVESLNEAYKDGQDEEERDWLKRSQKAYRKTLEAEEW